MKKLGLVGYPISHSYSPLIHESWLKHYGIEGEYELIEALTLEGVLFKKYDGLNITMPFKQKALNFLDHLSPEAEAMGTVNTLVKTPTGVKGYNTDALGVQSLLKGPYRKAVIVGTGGTSKAIGWALKGKAEEVIFLSTSGKGTPLAERETVLKGADFLANASPLGMIGFPDLSWDLAGLASAATVMEMVYTPLQTSLLKSTYKRTDLVVIDGLRLLLAQAKFSFHLWTGVFPHHELTLPHADAA